MEEFRACLADGECSTNKRMGLSFKAKRFFCFGMALLLLAATSQSAAQTSLPGQIRAAIDGVSNGNIVGWACVLGSNSSIQVRLYIGGIAGTGSLAGTYTANFPSNSTAIARCAALGAFNFKIPISNEMYTFPGDKTIHIYGVSPVNGNETLAPKSGLYSLPANSAPLVGITSPVNGSSTSSGSIVIQAAASDADDSVSKVGFYHNDQLIKTALTPPYMAGVSNLVNGVNRFYAVATDSRGSSTTSATVSLTAIQPPWTPPLIPPTGGIKRSYVYDEHQRLCKSIEPETQSTILEYDDAGNILWSASGVNAPSLTSCDRGLAQASGRIVTRAYDARNRVSTLSFPDGRGNQVWSYHANGLPSQATTYNGPGGTGPVVNSYVYNKRGLLTGESVDYAGTRTIGYAYNQLGHLVTQQYPTGMAVDFAPNALGQPTKAGAYATNVTYYPNGAIKQFTYGNGIVHTMIQNDRKLPSQSTDSKAGVTALDLSTSYDKNKNVTQVVDHLAGRQSRVMTYDGLDRLLQTTSPMFGAATYSYSKTDNLTSLSVTSGSDVRSYGYIYDANNRLSNLTNGVDGPSIVGMGYDDQGNLANKNGGIYQFDFGNRLRSAPGEIGYVYDAYGRRVSAASGLMNPRFRGFTYSRDGQLLYETDSGGNSIAENIYLSGSVLARRSTITNIPGYTPVTSYYHTDALGTPIAVSTQTGSISRTSEYEPYGKLINSPITNGIGYTGHMQDAATGFVYMQQRYYDPQFGLFLSVDPVTAYGGDVRFFNRYAYAFNNPYKFNDPDGRAPPGCGDGTCPTFREEFARGYDNGTIHANNGDTRISTGSTLGYAMGYATGSGIVRGGQNHGGIRGRSIGNATPDAPRSALHGNSRESMRPQHRYVIQDRNGDVVKTGISGRSLNQDGSSGRANEQVNALNKAEGSGAYSASVVETNIPGRAAALSSERAATTQLRDEGNTLRLQRRPKPER